MARNLDILDDQLELGQTKIISRDGGRIVDFVELLLSTSTKGQFAPSKDCLLYTSPSPRDQA